ncbi:magnesium transporter [Candidatus Dependentiae bacterium]|nr:magnesium transporter [Candidatus Dependentiae bacterium]
MLHTRNVEEILAQIENNILSVIREDTLQGQELWKKLLRQHHADIAEIIEKIDTPKQKLLFKKLPRALAVKVFQELTESIQASLIKTLDLDEAAIIFQKMPSDELTDLFECVSDEDLQQYLKLIQRKQRNKIISLLHLDPDSAGRIMNSDVITLQRDFTIKKSVSLLQRVEIPKETMRRIYVTNRDNILVGYINLEDLVINKSETPLTHVIHKNELAINVHVDQEEVARQMHHYGLLSAPVVDEQNNFLGVITADDIVDIVEEEASEDVYKMSGLAPVEHSYFQTTFSSLFFQRGIWLASLLIFQSLSGFILGKYQALIQNHVIMSFFLTMLIGTGGNAGNQSATLVIRGLATGEISRKNAVRVLVREFGMSIALASVLFLVTFARIYFLYHNLTATIAIGISLVLIINMSMILGAFIPFLLERLNLDPAHSAAPFLATLMDILGILIYCAVCSRFLG